MTKLIQNRLYRTVAAFAILLMVLPAAHIVAKPLPHKAARIPQERLGAMQGRITGGLLPLSGAKVQLVLKDEVVAITTTEDDGSYIFKFVDPAYYEVRVSKEGYRTRITTRVPVDEGHVTKMNGYLPKFNNKNMPKTPIEERYEYPKD